MVFEDKNSNWIDEDKIKKIPSRLQGHIDPVLKRKVIDLFVSKILIYPDHIDADYKIDPKDSDKVGGDKARYLNPRN